MHIRWALGNRGEEGGLKGDYKGYCSQSSKHLHSVLLVSCCRASTPIDMEGQILANYIDERVKQAVASSQTALLSKPKE